MEASRGAKEGSHTKRGGGGQLCIMQSPQEPRSSHSRVPLRSDGASSPIHRKSVFTLVPCTRTLILPLKPNCHTQCCVPHPVSSKGEILMIREGFVGYFLRALQQAHDDPALLSTKGLTRRKRLGFVLVYFYSKSA